MRRDIGVLVSGGLESVALVAHYLEHGIRVHPIYIRCGLRWEKAELHWIKQFLKSAPSGKIAPLQILSLPMGSAYQKNWSQTGQIPGLKSDDRAVYLPARNILLIVRAFLYLQSIKIYQAALGTLKGNPFGDGSRGYFNALEKVLARSFSRPIRILTPFRRLTKRDILRRFSHWPLHVSFSCINPQGLRPCHRCNKCAERKRAVEARGRSASGGAGEF